MKRIRVKARDACRGLLRNPVRPGNEEHKKSAGTLRFRRISGGAEGTRTPDPLHAMQVRYQLRHSPELLLLRPEILAF